MSDDYKCPYCNVIITAAGDEDDCEEKECSKCGEYYEINIEYCQSYSASKIDE